MTSPFAGRAGAFIDRSVLAEALRLENCRYHSVEPWVDADLYIQELWLEKADRLMQYIADVNRRRKS